MNNSVNLISKDSKIVEKLASALDNSIGDLLTLDTKVIATEFLSETRAIEQIELFISEVKKYSNFDFKGKKLLEIGSAVGTFLIVARRNYGIDACGIEPSSNEFASFKEVSSSLLEEYNMPKNLITTGIAEELPYPENSFDLIYSTNVLEHVKDPQKVLSESIRVLKPDGYLQFVIPNYFSFWEGHYGIFWPCIINKSTAKIYTKLILRNPKYIDTLHLVSPFYLRKILNKFKREIEVLSWGKEVFQKRLETGNYSDWATLQKIRPVIEFVQKIKASTLAANILNTFEMYTPIVLTIRKL